MRLNLDVEPEDQSDSSRKDTRRVPRSYPIFELPIFDVDDPTVEGRIQDISEKGVQVVGIQAREKQRKTFFIQANELDSVNPFSFEAECRWVHHSGDDECVAGFEITGISGKDLEQLQLVIQLLALSD